MRFQGKIVGGESIDITDAPYQVSLFSAGTFLCGGSIISENYIITAGHCAVYGAYSVNAGSSHTRKGGSYHYVKKVVVHEKYGTSKDGLPINDIALMEVYPPFELDETRKAVPLVNKGKLLTPGLHGMISGWGALYEGGYSSDELQGVQVPLISKEECQKKYAFAGTIPEGEICAAYPAGGKDSCQGDSGGPFVVEGNLAGIVSWGYGCARPGYPGVYTEVAYYHDWIRDNSDL